MLELEGLEPGPIVIEPMPFGPRVSREGLLESLAEPLVSMVQGSEYGLSVSSDQVSRDVPTDLNDAYARTAGQANVAHADQVRAGDATPAGELVDAGAGIDVYRAQALPHLPPPETGIASNLVPAPKPPADLVGGAEPPDLKDFG